MNLALAWKAGSLLAASYLLGSINVSYWVVRIVKDLDVRSVGSGNAGATNVVRAAGKRAGSIALLGDLVKGLGPVLLARAAGFAEPWPAAAGLAAVVGHVFPVFLGFRGGKGVATTGGVFLALAPLAALASMGVFLVVVWLTRFVSLASIAGTVAFPAVLAFWRPAPSTGTFACVAAIAALVVWKHRGNLARWFAGTERRLGER